MSDDPDLSAVARALAARETVDWRAAENNLPDPESAAILHELRIVAEIASFHRRPAAGPKGPIGTDAQSDRWGPLRITRLIGSGSFGDVYEAHDPSLDRVVALKLLRTVEATDNRDDAEVVHEGRLLARVRHPHVVTVFGAARIDGRTGIWMEFVKGQTLADRIAGSGPMSATDAAAVARDVCLGLSAIHDAGMVHRDIKAQNVMEQDGRIVLMDLGASFERARADAGAMVGTPSYLAPEVLRGEPPTIQSDLYSVGVLLWHLTTGGYPVHGASIDELRSAHLAGQRVALREVRPDLPRGFASIVEHALATAPADRFSDARAMAEALEDFIGQPTRRARAVIAGAIVTAVAIVASILWVRWAGAPSPPTVTPRKFILVGSFENHTGKDVFERTIQAGLEYELSKSVALEVTPSTRVEDALTLLNWSIKSTLTEPVAREVARRDGGIESVIVGRVDTVAGRDVISAQVVDPKTGAAAPLLQVRVASDAQASHAVRDVALEIRRHLGEAGALPSGTMISLESLRDYSDALRLANRGSWDRVLPLARQAVDRDPHFAMAQIWLAWGQKNTSDTPSKAAEAAQTATAAEAAANEGELTAAERDWILGSAAYIRGEDGPAVVHYEALLGVHPDDFWAINNLASLYRRSGATVQAAAMAAQAADLRPNAFDTQASATRELLQSGRDAAAVTQYDTRALRLLDTETGKTQTTAAAMVLLAPVDLIWRTRDAATTTTALAHIIADPRVVASRERADSVSRGAFGLYLAMGQVGLARNTATRITPSYDRDLLLATADFWAADLSSEQRLLDRLRYSSDGKGSIGGLQIFATLLIRLGELDEAEALLTRVIPAGPGDDVRGELAVARRDADGAIQILPKAIDRLDPAMGPYYRAIRALSDAWVQKHQLDTAMNTLRSALRHPSYSPADSGAGLEATALSFRLAALYRVAGDAKAADAVETGAMRGLERADPGFVGRLRDLARAGLDR